MKYLTLVCASGMSTSMMMKRMQDCANKKGIETTIVAMSETAFRKYTEPTDVLLLGPQVSYLLDALKKEYEPRGIRVMVIDMMDYGMMNGEKVLQTALDLLK